MCLETNDKSNSEWPIQNQSLFIRQQFEWVNDEQQNCCGIFQRFGVALVREGQLKLKSAQYKLDMQPIDVNCECSTCKTYTRSYLHHIVRKEEVASSLLTVHNVAFQVNAWVQMVNPIRYNPQHIRFHFSCVWWRTCERALWRNVFPNSSKNLCAPITRMNPFRNGSPMPWPWLMSIYNPVAHSTHMKIEQNKKWNSLRFQRVISKFIQQQNFT